MSLIYLKTPRPGKVTIHIIKYELPICMLKMGRERKLGRRKKINRVFSEKYVGNITIPQVRKECQGRRKHDLGRMMHKLPINPQVLYHDVVHPRH